MNLNESLKQHGAKAKESGWNSFSNDVQHERSQMVRRFHIWIADKRHATEKELMRAQRDVREAVPFARAGLSNASAPAVVPLAVVDFAQSVLDAMELEREFALLNKFYLEAANGECDDLLTAKSDDEGVNQLWEQFIGEQEIA